MGVTLNSPPLTLKFYSLGRIPTGRTTMLRLYIVHIRAKLDYGSAIFDQTSPSYVYFHKFSSERRSADCDGCIRSSTKQSLKVKTSIIPSSWGECSLYAPFICRYRFPLLCLVTSHRVSPQQSCAIPVSCSCDFYIHFSWLTSTIGPVLKIYQFPLVCPPLFVKAKGLFSTP